MPTTSAHESRRTSVTGAAIQPEAELYSNLYDDASMPFMQRITWSGIALHAGALPGYPASHGCVRMPPPFAADLKLGSTNGEEAGPPSARLHEPSRRVFNGRLMGKGGHRFPHGA